MSLMYFQPRALILVLIPYFPSSACLSELFLSIVPHLFSPHPLPSLDHINLFLSHSTSSPWKNCTHQISGTYPFKALRGYFEITQYTVDSIIVY